MKNEATVKVFKRRPFSAVPDDILTNKSLSAEARLVLSYLVGRPADWVIYVSQVQKALGISEARWARARRELQAAHYYRQIRSRSDGGKWSWENLVFDTPTPLPEDTIHPIPLKSMDGGNDGKDGRTIPPPSMDGESMDEESKDGKQGDITEKLLTNNLNKGNEQREGGAERHQPAGTLSHDREYFFDPETGILLQHGNARDQDALATLKAKFGVEAIKKAVQKITETGGSPWVSAVQRLLTPPAGNGKTRQFLAPSDFSKSPGDTSDFDKYRGRGGIAKAGGVNGQQS